MRTFAHPARHATRKAFGPSRPPPTVRAGVRRRSEIRGILYGSALQPKLDSSVESMDRHLTADGDARRFAAQPKIKVATRPSRGSEERVQRQSPAPSRGGSEAGTETGNRPGCTPGPGISNSDCAAYVQNAWWLPLAYVNNATCACLETPNTPTANCVRKFLQDRMAATPWWLKTMAAGQKPMETMNHVAYQSFVQTMLTPRIYDDHVDAYRTCCCPSGPADYWSWIGVTTIPIQPCSWVGAAIREFGSCHGTPGQW